MKIARNGNKLPIASAVIVVGIAANLADAQAADPTQVTGCLSPFGLLTKAAPGDQPARPCKATDQLVHVQLSAPLGQTAKRVFLTSETFTGNLGGVSGAHAKCQSAADAAGLGGTWRAWIADDTISPATDPNFTKNEGPYVRLDGIVVAMNWEDLTDSGLLAPINLDETGKYNADVPDVSDVRVWTATDFSGNSSFGLDNCNSWTYDGGSSLRGSDGLANRWTSQIWTAWEGSSCESSDLHLYCFEQ